MLPVKFLLLMVSTVTWALPTDFNQAERRPYNNGRPAFKAIVVTSKPFGYAPISNEVNASRKRVTSTTTPATPTTTTTTGSPFEYKIAQPTIPFFSISCSVGSSCSQIISARKVPTPKPTFKPYTKEDREKFKLAYNQVFGPTALLTASLSEKATVKSTATTTTTPKPLSTSIWRVRTTTSPNYIRTATTPKTITTTTTLTTKTKPTLSSAIKEFAINSAIESVSKWKWPSESINNRNTMLVHSAPMKLANPNGTPNKPTALSAFPHQDNKQSMSKWLSSLLVTSINNAIAQKKAQNNAVHQHNSYKPEVYHNEIKQKPVESVQALVGKEVINTKGHKTTIITGSSVRQQQLKNSQVHQANENNVKLPPEFTVSSHGIRLQVAPKSRVQSARFVQNYQGVDIEMDDEDDANLSELIMKHYPMVPKRSFK